MKLKRPVFRDSREGCSAPEGSRALVGHSSTPVGTLELSGNDVSPISRHMQRRTRASCGTGNYPPPDSCVLKYCRTTSRCRGRNRRSQVS